MAEKLSNNKLYNKSGFSDEKQGNIFSNIYIIIIIVIIALLFIGFAAYYAYTKLTSDELNILIGNTYYGSDIPTYVPVFYETSKSVNDCINLCNNDLTCDGITYNSDSKSCSGTQNGLLRGNEPSNYSAWVKPVITLSSDIKKDFSKSILVGNTKSFKSIDGQLLQKSYTTGNFSYSFNLTIFDFYKNYGSWRHIFHKGTQIVPGTVLTYQSWENLILDFPDQSIGIWLAPFTNNLRIAVTTQSSGNQNKGSYSHAFVEKCDNAGDCYITDMPSGKWVKKEKKGDGSTEAVKINTYVEYFDHDLQNIPINKQVNITINFRGRDVEIYYNGQIVKVVRLDAMPKLSTNNTNLYVMNDNTFCGNISNLLYYPDALLLQDISDIMALAPPVNV